MMAIQTEKDFLNNVVEHFYIEYSDKTVYKDYMPVPGAVNFFVALTLKDTAQADALKQCLAKYGIKAKDCVYDNVNAVRFLANQDDPFMSVLGNVLQQRKSGQKTGILKYAQKKLLTSVENTKIALSRVFGNTNG